MIARESAVIVAVPEAESAVAEFRLELDRSAKWGVPAHVTVIYPFLPPDQIGTSELGRLGEAIRSVRAFDVTFSRLGWFGEDAVWLAPDPDDGFRALVSAVWLAFPNCPPYSGAYADVVPHLTIGAHCDPHRLTAAGDSVVVRLPITASIGTADVFVGADAENAWRRVAALPLGPARA